MEQPITKMVILKRNKKMKNSFKELENLKNLLKLRKKRLMNLLR